VACWRAAALCLAGEEWMQLKGGGGRGRGRGRARVGVGVCVPACMGVDRLLSACWFYLQSGDRTGTRGGRAVASQ
jgi:hypothetical protein